MKIKKQVAGFFLVLLSRAIIFGGNIELIPLTIGEGKDIFGPAIFNKNAEAARMAGVDLSLHLNDKVASGYSKPQFFILFYNYAQAPDCERDFLIQRVKLTKSFDVSGVGTDREKNQYLVEVMKLDNNKRLKKPDEHRKRYSLGNSSKRELTAEYEIGCGEIPGVATGAEWPFETHLLYRRLQDYSEDPGIYDQVHFDFLKSYKLEVALDARGQHFIKLPEFLNP